jgi:GT2 family glycosyltransferase
MSRTAVVILNYNGAQLLRQYLPSVIQHSQEATIIVADNNSTDASQQVMLEQYPEITFIRLDQNYGYCGGYNRALAKVNADYCVLLNSDVEVSAGWLQPMIDLMDSDGAIAAVQPKVLSHRQKNKFEYAGAGGGFIDTLGYPFCRGRVFDSVEEDHGQYDDVREVFWATGACLMVRTSMFTKFNGFDEDFFAHMEEIDLCWKFQRTGARVMYCGKSTVYHLGAGTLGYAAPQKTYLNFRNGLSVLLKHLNTSELFYKLPLRIVLDWIAAVQFLLKGKAGNFSAILRAHYNFLVFMNRDLRKRRVLHRHFPTYCTTNIYRGSVVIDHYMKGKQPVV